MEATDTIDAKHYLASESLTTAAQEIHRRHQAVTAKKGSALSAVAEVCTESMEIAALVEQVHSQLGGARFAKWWREQKMPEGWGKRYLTLHKTRGRNALADKDQLRLIGLMPEPEAHNQGHHRQQKTMFHWLKWSHKITKSFDGDAIERYGPADAQNALKFLEPIEAIINKLKAKA